MVMHQNIASFLLTQKHEQLLMKATLIMYLNQSIVRLSQTYKNFVERVQAKVLIQL